MELQILIFPAFPQPLLSAGGGGKLLDFSGVSHLAN